jgi:hypothetical protein
MAGSYRRNHYVPQWYQQRFIPAQYKERRFYYLDMKPAIAYSNGMPYQRNAMLRWGPAKCFCQDDLYTTKFGGWESTEIEEGFFGRVDSSAPSAVEYFATFEHPSADHAAFHGLLPFMSIQKLRTPKGLAYLSSITKLNNKNLVLMALQHLQHMFCAHWTESVWSIADASQASSRFILSDHPVTAYNEGCFPASAWCEDYRDPDIWMSGTHTLFPMSLDKILILTNLSWVRNPYGDPKKLRPNPNPFRPAIFNFMQIQTGRVLTDTEVFEINYIIKSRAYRYIAAVEKEWLFPERQLRGKRWDRFGDGYLLMPDPRSVTFSSEMIFGYDNRPADRFDEYGRQPSQPGFGDEARRKSEMETFHAFQGEFARVFGPKRRGLAFEFGAVSRAEDSPDYRQRHRKGARMARACKCLTNSGLRSSENQARGFPGVQGQILTSRWPQILGAYLRSSSKTKQVWMAAATVFLLAGHHATQRCRNSER